MSNGFDIVKLQEMKDAKAGGRCPWCKKDMFNTSKDDFDDAISFKEFGISGLCQQCQDDAFNQPEEGD